MLLDDTTYERYDDTYDSGLDTHTGGDDPPEGMFVPGDALGKVWREQPEVQDTLGFATALPIEIETQMLMLERGEMIYFPPSASVIAFKRGTPSTWSSYNVVVQP